MSDVRSLLRQQRTARRIEHPHAAYSDAGKLLCTLCHEQVKTESLWDGHVRSEGHRKRAQRQALAATRTNGHGHGHGDAAAPMQKRKHDHDGDQDEDMDDAMRRKRSKPDIAAAAESEEASKDQTLTPPRLIRRTSMTPSHGVELQIPSRPATPAHRDGSSSSTPGGHLSALASQSATNSLPSRQPSLLAPEDRPSSMTPQVDESEWAAFEADIAAVSAPFDEDAVISAPAMTAEQSAAAVKAEEDAAEKHRAQADVDLEDEKEEATRALEEEFEEMEELEARVRRLKEKREALRKRSESFNQDGAAATKLQGRLGKENLETAIIEEDEDDDDDDDEEDDWDGFRFRTAV